MSKTVANTYAPGSPARQGEGASLYAIDGSRKYLNLAERQRALGTMAKLDPDSALFSLTLAWTGARVSEVLALTPASFQVERGLHASPATDATAGGRLRNGYAAANPDGSSTRGCSWLYSARVGTRTASLVDGAS
jgi:integrase